MSDTLKATLILAATILLLVCIKTYFSPYHSCLRAYSGSSQQDVSALRCARAVGGHVEISVSP